MHERFLALWTILNDAWQTPMIIVGIVAHARLRRRLARLERLEEIRHPPRPMVTGMGNVIWAPPKRTLRDRFPSLRTGARS